MTLDGAVNIDRPDIQVEDSGNFVFSGSLVGGGQALFYVTIENR